MGNLQSMISTLDPTKFKTNYIYKKENKLANSTRKAASHAKTRNDRKLLDMEFLNDEMRELLQSKMNKLDGLEDIPTKNDLEDNDKELDSEDGEIKDKNKIDFGAKLENLTIVLKRLPYKS